MRRQQSTPDIPLPDLSEERPSGVRPRTAKVLSLTEFVGSKAEPTKKTRRAPKVDEARRRMREMAESTVWDDARGIHLVAVYEMLHAEVYGVAPLELDNKAWVSAAGLAGRMVEKYFDGDFGAAVSMMRWVWQREKEREAWRRANAVDGRRIGWPWQFSATLVSDYRVHGQRSAGR